MKIEVNGRIAHAATGGVDITTPDRADDPIMLLIHGAGMDGTVWQLQTRYLAYHGFRPVAVDLPGHGASEGEPLTTIAELADWVAGFIDALPLEPTPGSDGDAGGVHVVGHSMGSFVGLELAARHADRVASLTLLGAADGMPVHPDLLTASAEQLDKAAALMASWGHAKPAHIGLNPTPGLWMLGGSRALVESSVPGALTTDFQACADYGDAIEMAGRIGCPVRVVIGAGDKMTPPRATAKLVEALESGGAPSVEVTRLDDTGHMMMIESPRPIRHVLTHMS